MNMTAPEMLQLVADAIDRAPTGTPGDRANLARKLIFLIASETIALVAEHVLVNYDGDPFYAKDIDVAIRSTPLPIVDSAANPG